MKVDELNNRHLIADEGKVLRRISDNWVAGAEIYLGYTYYLGGEQLAEPLFELPEHYEEIDESELLTDEIFETEAQLLIEPETSLMSLAEPIPEQSLEPATLKLTELLVRYINKTEQLEKEIAELKKTK